MLLEVLHRDDVVIFHGTHFQCEALLFPSAFCHHVGRIHLPMSSPVLKTHLDVAWAILIDLVLV